jgi:G3E family GTPase
MVRVNIPIMSINTERKRIYFNRATITLLGEPTHLFFRLDEQNERLIILPAVEETLDAYEIPQHFWKDNRRGCQVSRLPFFLTLMQISNWKSERIYEIKGIFQVFERTRKLVVFNLDEAIEVENNRIDEDFIDEEEPS